MPFSLFALSICYGVIKNIKNSILTFLVKLVLVFHLFFLVSDPFLFLFPICRNFYKYLCHPPAWNAILCSLQPTLPSHGLFLKTMSVLITLTMLMSPGTQWADNPLPKQLAVAVLSILSNGSACLPMPTETVIFMKPPLLQISCCWQKFIGCF